VNQKLGTSGSAGSGCQGKVFSNNDDYRSWDLVDARIRRGYNTNYTQSWYMARTEMKKSGNVKKVANAVGPLKLTAMLKVSPSRVPLLGDGGLEDETGGDSYHGNYAASYGTRTVKTMGDGPYGGGAWAPQTYSDFGPAHGYANRSSGKKSSVRDRANVLLGDGHVDQFIDKRGNYGGPRDGVFGLSDQDNNGTLTYVQDDLDPRIFDGVLSLGRRSLDPEGITRK
jgi:prepilin-type processing-associated H-X9-DG protein